jgi:DNA-binding SARP family transcriptional activator/TolB-like protein/Tfp pilus assembly protein PilF
VGGAATLDAIRSGVDGGTGWARMSERTIKAAPGLSTAENKVVPLDLGRSTEPLHRYAPRQPIVRIHVLGPMRATTYLGQSILPRGKKARALLGYLCLFAGERVARGRLAGMLWDRVPDSQARTSFRQALRELSSAMGPLADELISGDRDTVRLESGACWIDALAVLSSEPLPSHSSRADLASLCSGQLLEELDGTSASFDQWLLTERTRFTDRLRGLLEGELHQLDRAGTDAEKRAMSARRVIAFDPTHEGASRTLMRALSDMGERAQALREYERCREALRFTLDVEPSSETRALYQALKTFSRSTARDDQVVTAIRPGRRLPQSPILRTDCNRLRVAVLPFGARSLDPNEGLAFSISQEIAAALARFRWFDVIAPMSLPRRADTRLSEAQLRRKQLHYVVDGDLSGSEEKFHISVRLLDITQEARPIWNERFELTAEGLDRVNELIIAPVVARIDPIILFIEGQQKRSQRVSAAGLVLQAIPLMYSMGREKYEEAGKLIAQALEAEPKNANVAAWGAYWYVWYVGQGWSPDPRSAVETAQELAVRAISLDPENAEALGIYGHICSFLDKDFDSAVNYFDKALRLNPNLAFIWALSAPTYCYIGQPDEALRRLDRYRDLALFDPYFGMWESFYTIAYMFKGDYEKAASVGRRAVRSNPGFSNGYKPLIAALGHLGRRDEAAPYLEKLRSLEPNFTIEQFGKTYPFKRSEDRERYMQGLRLAGVPDA